MPFRLRHLQHNFELSQGEFLIGRSAECQLALDDPLVSRKHALLLISQDSVVIKDLGSRNGVVVNGTKIDTSRILLDGDRVVIGSQEMTLVSWQRDPLHVARRRTGSQTLSSVVSAGRHPIQSDSGSDVSKRVDSFPLLSTLADKALALGRPEDAERILASLLAELLKQVQAENPIGNEIVDQAAQYGDRLEQVRIANVLELELEIVRKGPRGRHGFHGRVPERSIERLDGPHAKSERIDFESERGEPLDDRGRHERELLGPGGGRGAHGEHPALEAHR